MSARRACEPSCSTRAGRSWPWVACRWSRMSRRSRAGQSRVPRAGGGGSPGGGGAGGLGWKWQVANFDRSWLPELVDPTGTLGELTPTAAGHLGLAAGTPLIASAGDKQAEALGAGAVTPDVAALFFGTTATIGTTHRRYLEAIPLLPPYPAATPGAGFVELPGPRGVW